MRSTRQKIAAERFPKPRESFATHLDERSHLSGQRNDPGRVIAKQDRRPHSTLDEWHVSNQNVTRCQNPGNGRLSCSRYAYEHHVRSSKIVHGPAVVVFDGKVLCVRHLAS